MTHPYNDPPAWSANKRKAVCKSCGLILKTGEAVFYYGYRCPTCANTLMLEKLQFDTDYQAMKQIVELVRQDDGQMEAMRAKWRFDWWMTLGTNGYKVGYAALALDMLSQMRNHGEKITHQTAFIVFDDICHMEGGASG